MIPRFIKFHMYMENSLLAYGQESKLGMSQIQQLRGLVLFDFATRYQTGRSKKGAVALIRHPYNLASISKSSTDSDEVKVI